MNEKVFKTVISEKALGCDVLRIIQSEMNTLIGNKETDKIRVFSIFLTNALFNEYTICFLNHSDFTQEKLEDCIHRYTQWIIDAFNETE